MRNTAWSRIVAFTLVAAGAAARAQEKPPEEVLKGKELRRSGSLYILPGEAEVAKKLHAAQRLRRELAFVTMQHAATRTGAEDNKKMIVALTQQRLQLKQQLPLAQSVEQHNQIVDAMNDLVDRINLLQQGGVDAGTVKDAARVVETKREAYLQSLLDTRNLVDATLRSYAALAEDAEVKAALASLSSRRKDRLGLGPSRALKADIKALEAMEAAIQSETIKLRREGDTFWVDVTLNGKLVKPMIFDTGASLVTLSSDLAAELGMKVGKDLPDVRLQVADGRVVVGKRTKLASVRVGKFTVADVDCAVLPGRSDEGVPPLLGQSFLKNFAHRLDPSTGALKLSKVGAAANVKVEARAGADPKGKAR
jgi:clan AA aspartic protease (TIGR02281 family)